MRVYKAVLMLATLVIFLPSAAQAEEVVYSNNFESGSPLGFSSSSIDTTPVGNRRFLGQFGHQTVTLNLNDLPTHATATVSFKLFIIGSWDGNDPSYGSDVWNLSADGTSLLNTTFSNIEGRVQNRQTYPGTFPGGDFAAQTGAAEKDTLGYGSDFFTDSVYNLSYTFAHSAGSLRFNFSGASGVMDESWGLDDVSISVNGDSTPPPPAPVPEPATMLLLGTGLVGVVTSLRRRSKPSCGSHEV